MQHFFLLNYDIIHNRERKEIKKEQNSIQFILLLYSHRKCIII